MKKYLLILVIGLSILLTNITVCNSKDLFFPNAKFKVGDTIYIIKDGRIARAVIRKVEPESSKLKFKYLFEESVGFSFYYERDVYKTIKEAKTQQFGE